MDSAAKPYYICEVADVSLQSAFESGTSEVRKCVQGEVFEVLEGARKEAPQETERVRGRATKDGKSGYLTLKDAQGNSSLELSPVSVCLQSIAITTTFDIGDSAGKALRKLEKGEAFEVLEAPVEDAKRNLTRCKVKVKKDNIEGFVTIKGNQGTTYAEESQKHYVVKKSIALESKLASDSTALRTLEEGEIFEVTDGPKKETKEGANRVRGRSLSDGAEGWLSVSTKSVSAWAPCYKCVSSTALHDKFEVEGATVVRKISPGEIVEALAVPSFEAAAGIVRVRARATKDGAVGFATVRGNQGTALLECVFRTD